MTTDPQAGHNPVTSKITARSQGCSPSDPQPEPHTLNPWELTRSTRWWRHTTDQAAVDAACNQTERILRDAHRRMDRLGYPRARVAA